MDESCYSSHHDSNSSKPDSQSQDEKLEQTLDAQSFINFVEQAQSQGQGQGQSQVEGHSQDEGQGQVECDIPDIKEECNGNNKDTASLTRRCRNKRVVKVNRKKATSQSKGHDSDQEQSQGQGRMPDIKEEYNYIVLPNTTGKPDVKGNYRIKQAVKAKQKRTVKPKEKQCKKDSKSEKKEQTEEHILKMPLKFKCIVCSQCFTTGECYFPRQIFVD